VENTEDVHPYHPMYGETVNFSKSYLVGRVLFCALGGPDIRLIERTKIGNRNEKWRYYLE